ncbi:hypothetical protein Q5P01_018065 [Channa striata]|uniref:Uncharacterized protein n=1 Tax=Channa striata TaxID=64152 RepID=A0AA88M499_CHASR|nr:hypothetical protein Q5P01_018065 [Channa striata]
MVAMRTMIELSIASAHTGNRTRPEPRTLPQPYGEQLGLLPLLQVPLWLTEYGIELSGAPATQQNKAL